uniref:Putative family 31 glucosidase KIAA1161 n=1 Tax=Lygus hesperus TaxID=30085 RepID=A0A146M3J7_LYGHE
MFVAQGNISEATQWTGAVAERKWITSGGRGIHVKPGSPLFVTQNSSHLCLMVSNRPPYSANSPVLLEYDFCLTNNAKEAWLCQNSERPKPRLPPESEYILKEPIWSTWVAYKSKISQQTVMDFAGSIKNNGLRMGVMEIDDKWETCYGSQLIDKTMFPNPKKMVEDLHTMGAKVTFWVHPFINVDCNSFEQLQQHLFTYPNGTVGITTWWNGQAGLINILQKDTYEFFTGRLQTFKKDYGADGFKFDAGEAYYIPGLFKFTPLIYPNEYTRTYVKLAESFGPTTEVRVGADSSSMDLFQRLQDTNSDWTLDNYGLKSVITSSLQLSILGYRAIMPDMVGGNCYGPPPDKELFIRWVQLTAFLPVMQFSYHPWKFDEETVNITKRYIDLHYNYSSRMVEIFNTAEVPLISPVWWLDPDNPIALQTKDQFLVGDEILVAPVVEKGAYNRSVFIPSGSWTDANNGQPIKGPLIIPEYPAPIEKLPYFIRLKS